MLAWADIVVSTTPVTEVSDGKYYVITSNSTPTFSLCKFDQAPFYNTSGGLGGSDDQTRYCWKLEKQSDGTYALKSCFNNTYADITFYSETQGYINISDTPVGFTVGTKTFDETTAFYFKTSEGKYLQKINGWAASFTEDEPTTISDASMWTLYEVTGLTTYTLSSWELYSSTDNTNPVATKSFASAIQCEGIEGLDIRAQLEKLLKTNLPEAYYDVALENGVAKITEKSGIPFVISSGDAEAWNWQTITVRSKQMVYTGTNVSAGTRTLHVNNLWAFVRDNSAVNSFYLYNLGAGTDKPMGVANTNNGTLLTADTENSVKTFNVRPNSYGGFSIAVGNNPIEDIGNKDVLKVWSGGNFNENGNNVIASNIDDLISPLASYANAVTKEGCVGSYTNGTVFAAAYADYSSEAPTQKTTSLKTLCEGVGAKTELDVNKFYRIRTTGYYGGTSTEAGIVPGKTYTDEENLYPYLAATNATANTDGSINADNDRGVIRTAKNDKDLGNIWFFGTGSQTGQYYLKNANTQLGINTAYQNGRPYFLEMNTEAGGEVKLADGKNSASFKIANVSGNSFLKAWEMNHLYDPKNGENQNAQVSFGNDALHEWYIEEVNAVTLTVSSVKWASVTYPFAVKIADGLTAYYATSISGSTLTIKPIEDGIIPANTPVVIEATTAGNYTMEISYDNAGTDVSATNKFSGSTVSRVGFATDGYYALIKYNDAAVFGKSDGVDAVPANKAYIPGTALTTAPKLFFNGEDDVTGIENVGVQNNGEKVYYDLNGRRVANPTTGLYITESGQKVFIR